MLYRAAPPLPRSRPPLPAADAARAGATRTAEAQKAMHTMLTTLKGKMGELLAVAAAAGGDQQKAVAGASPIVTAALQTELTNFGFMPGMMGLMGGFAAFKAIINTPEGADLQKGAPAAPARSSARARAHGAGARVPLSPGGARRSPRAPRDAVCTAHAATPAKPLPSQASTSSTTR